jgi:phosphoglycerate dehydrogenase-like enzyme
LLTIWLAGSYCLSVPPRPEPLPRIVVLCGTDQARPAGLDELGADALFVWDFFSPAVRAAWPNADRLRWIHVAATGVDAILFDDLISAPVVLTNARGIFDEPIAEYVLATILAQVKQLYVSRKLQQCREWQHRETRTVAGQQVLVIGTGGIGRAIARLLRAVGLRVRGAGRTAREQDPDFGSVVASAELAAHVGDVDHLVMIAPLTPETTGMINQEVLAALKPGAHLINVGRGPSVDEDALLAALRSGRLGAASLDVFSTEPLPEEHPFWAMENVVISPHLSGDTEGWTDRLAAQFVDNANRWLTGEELINIVDKQRGYSSAPSTSPALSTSSGSGA